MIVGGVEATLDAKDNSMSSVAILAAQRVANLRQELIAMGVEAGPAFDSLASKLRIAELNLRSLQDTTDGAKQGLKNVGDGAEKTTDQLSQLNSLAIRLMERLLIFYALRETFTFVTGLYSAAEAMTKLQDQSELTLVKIQELQYGASVTDIPFNKVAEAVDNFDKKLAEMKMSTADVLASLGLSFGQLFAMSPDERFDAIATAIASLPTQLQRTKAEVELFGSDAIDPLIKNYLALTKAAHDSNSIVGDETINALSNTAKMYKALGTEISSFADTVIEAGQRTVEAWSAPIFGGNLPTIEMIMGFMMQGPMGMLAPPKAATDINLPAPKRGGAGGDLGGRGYIDQLVAESAATKSLTAEQSFELGVLKELDLLDSAHASHIDGMTTPALKAYTDQVKAHSAEQKKAAEFAKQWNVAIDDLNSAGEGWKGTLDSIDGETVEAVKYYLQAGVAQHELALAYGLTEAQVKAVAKSLEDEKQAQEVALRQEEQVRIATDAYYKAYNASSKDSLTTQINDAYLAADAKIAAMTKSKNYSIEAEMLIWKTADLTTQNLITAWAIRDTSSKAYYLNQKNQAEDDYDNKVANSELFTSLDIQLSLKRRDAAREEYNNWKALADQKLLDQQKLSAAATEIARQAAEKQRIMDMGGSFDLPVLTDDSVKQQYGGDAAAKARLKYIQDYYNMYPGAAPGGSGPTGLAPNDQAGWQRLLAMQQEYLELKAHYPQAAEGGLIKVGERGPEVVRLPVNSQVAPSGYMPGGGAPSVIHYWNVNGSGEQVAAEVKAILMRDQFVNRMFGSV